MEMNSNQGKKWLNCTFQPLSFKMLQFWLLIKKITILAPLRLKIAEKTPRVPKRSHNRNFFRR